MSSSIIQSRAVLQGIWVINLFVLLGIILSLVTTVRFQGAIVTTDPWEPPQDEAVSKNNSLGSMSQFLNAAKVLAPPTPKPVETTPVKAEPTTDTLKGADFYLLLKGTVVDSQLSVAFLEVKKSKEQRAAYLGDLIEGYKIEKILPGEIHLTQAGRPVAPLKVVKVDVQKIAQTTPSRSNTLPGPKQEQEVAKEDVQKLAKEPSQLLRDVGFTPYIDSSTGKIKGMKVTRIASNSIFAKRGVRVGDIVTSINGKATTGIQAAMALMQELPDADSFVIKLLRRGRPQTLRFKVN